VVEKAHTPMLAARALEVQHSLSGLQRVEYVRRRGSRVLGGPLEMRVDVGRCVDNRPRPFATEAVDEVGEGAELQVLLPRSVEIGVVEEKLEAAKDLLAACRWVEHGEAANNLLARHESTACDCAEYLKVASGDAEGRGIVRSRQPLQLRRQR
jgi:hypothetical protein